MVTRWEKDPVCTHCVCGPALRAKPIHRQYGWHCSHPGERAPHVGSGAASRLGRTCAMKANLTAQALRLANPHAGGNMKSRTLTCITAITLFAALALPGELAAQHRRHKLLDLGTFGGTNSLANSVNNSGQVVGGAENTIPDPFDFGGLLGLPSPTEWHGFVWQNGSMQDLGTLGGPDSFAVTVSETGQIVGASFTNSVSNSATGIPTLEPIPLAERQNDRSRNSGWH